MNSNRGKKENHQENMTYIHIELLKGFWTDILDFIL